MGSAGVSGPSISGPSFLGLDQPAAERGSSGRGSSAGLDSSRTSGNLDYLLEDDEEPKSGGAGKIVAILVALALVAGLGYLRWRTGGFAWLMGSKKPAVSDSGTAVSDSSAPSSAGATPDASPAASGISPAPAQTSTQPSSGPDAANPAATPTSAPGAGGSPGTDAVTPANKDDSAKGGSAIASKKTAAAKDGSAPDSDASGDSDEESAKAPVEAPKPKPTAKPTPARPVDAVVEAEKYIYGRGGMKQDCERGMKMLRPQAEHSNVKAMSSLGVLYSAGLCTPRDLPTSYRWIALALRKEPDNQALKDNLQKLRSEMTQPERQLAIKLSQ